MGVLSRAFLGLGIALGVTSASFAASAAADLSDSDIERVLSKGKITKKEDIGTGVTNPLRFWIELEGVTVSASFKDVDYEKRGVTRSASGNAELSLADSWDRRGTGPLSLQFGPVIDSNLC